MSSLQQAPGLVGLPQVSYQAGEAFVSQNNVHNVHDVHDRHHRDTDQELSVSVFGGVTEREYPLPRH